MNRFNDNIFAKDVEIAFKNVVCACLLRYRWFFVSINHFRKKTLEIHTDPPRMQCAKQRQGRSFGQLYPYALQRRYPITHSPHHFPLNRHHRGVLATKVGYFWVRPTKVPRGQMGTKPAKVGRLAATLLK